MNDHPVRELVKRYPTTTWWIGATFVVSLASLVLDVLYH